jgi:hypothetical protein
MIELEELSESLEHHMKLAVNWLAALVLLAWQCPQYQPIVWVAVAVMAASGMVCSVLCDFVIGEE